METLREKLDNFRDDNLSSFDNLSQDELKELSKYVKWFEAGSVIQYLGAEKLKEFLPALLAMLQDINWPAAKGVSQMFENWKVVYPAIETFLSSEREDDTWIHNVLRFVVSYWPENVTSQLTPQLEIICTQGFESSIVALELLRKQKLVSEERLLEIFRDMQLRFADLPYWLDDLNETFYA